MCGKCGVCVSVCACVCVCTMYKCMCGVLHGCLHMIQLTGSYMCAHAYMYMPVRDEAPPPNLRVWSHQYSSITQWKMIPF